MSRNIFMIHGMMVGPWCWDNYKAFFEQRGYSCSTPALRFHDTPPDSSPDPLLGTTGLLDYAEDLEKELLKFDSPPIIMGHSMGGLLTQILVSRGLAETAVLLSPAPPRGVMALTPSGIRCFSDVLKTPGFWKKPFKFSFEKTVYSCLDMMSEEKQKEVYSRLVHESGRTAFEIGLWLLDKNISSNVNTKEVKCPLLIVSGREDRFIPPSVVKRIANKYKDVSTHREFKDNAHWVIGEPGWENIAEYIYDWLEKQHR